MGRRILHIILFLLVFAPALKSQDEQPELYKIKRMPFSSGFYSEISPVIINDGIIFCSDRRFSGIRDRTSFQGKRIYNMYLVQPKDTSDWLQPDEIKGERTNMFNSGPLCFSADGKTIFFTSEVETGHSASKRNFKNHSGIFYATVSGSTVGTITPFQYNSTQYDIGQPSISKDGKYLFFSSNMPGGQGGNDIYYCELINNTWDKPKNLGNKINTSGNENYPFIHPSGRLYFSSDKPGGKGKMDVYYSSLYLGSWEDPVAMPEPVNSSADDFAFVFDDQMQDGYFASNRERTDDIFRITSTVIRKASCDTLSENNYCYQLEEVNAVKFDTLPFRYEWKLGDGTKGIGPSVVHCYPGPGTYHVQLDVVNLVTKEVLYNEKSYDLEIMDKEQPYISAPDEVIAGQKIHLSAEKTNLPGWNISRYYWNFNDGTVIVGKDVDKVYNKPGTYTVQLIVSVDPEPGAPVREACVCKNIIIRNKP
jgi:hypothetical protein